MQRDKDDIWDEDDVGVEEDVWDACTSHDKADPADGDDMAWWWWWCVRKQHVGSKWCFGWRWCVR